MNLLQSIQVDPVLTLWLAAVAGVLGPHIQAIFNNLGRTWAAWEKQAFSIVLAMVIGAAVIVVYTYSEKGGQWPAGFHDWVFYLVTAYVALQVFYKTLFNITANKVEAATSPSITSSNDPA